MILFRRWKLVVSLAILFSIVFFSWYFVFGFKSSHPGSYFNKGLNAAWIGHKWVEETVSEQKVKELVDGFKERQIKYVFVHVGPIDESGVIPAKRYSEARDFIFTAKKFSDDIVYEAWMGQLRNKLDLSKGHIRDRVATVAHRLVHDIGFDGIHLNIEPTQDGDSEFLFLLKDIRDKIGTTPLFSVAIGELIPKKVTGFLKYFADDDNKVFGYRLDKNYNTTEFYRALAKYVDQFAVMAYDTSIKDPKLYRWFVEQQVIYTTRAVPDRQVFIGIPTYSDVRPNFDAGVENIENGILGVTAGLNNFRSKYNAFTGISIYAYWETDSAEWEIFNELWLKKQESNQNENAES